MHEDLRDIIELPEGVEASLDTELIIKGPKGEVKREFPLDIKIEGKELKIFVKNATKREKKIMKTSIAHIKNMIKGVQEGFTYKLQICSVHFPMTVKVNKDKISVKNFLGEGKERETYSSPGVEVKIQGDIVTVSSIDKEAAGQTAARLESLTKVKKKDRRVFQDGIWMIEKPGKELLS